MLGAHRRGRDPRPPHRRVRPRAEDADRVLHPHAHRRPREPAQQRRDRRAAGLQRHAVGRGHERRGADPHPDRHAQHVVARDRARGDHAARLPRARAPHGRSPRRAAPRGRRPQLRHEHADDGALLGARRDPREAVRPPRRGVRGVPCPCRPRPRHRGAHRDAAVRLRHRADARLRPRARARLRARRRPRARRAAGHRRGRHPRAPPHALVRAADRPRERAGRDHERGGQLRAGLRGAGPRAAHPGEARRSPSPRGPGGGRVRRRPLRLPVGRQGVAGLPRGGLHARHPRRRGGAARRVLPHRAGADRRARRHVRRRQVHDRAAPLAPVRRRQRCRAARGDRRARRHLRIHAAHARHGDPGRPPVPRDDPVQPAPRAAGGHRRRGVGRGPARAARAAHPLAA